MSRKFPCWLLVLCIAACGGGSSEPTDATRLRPAVEKSTGWDFKTVPTYERIDRDGLLRHLEAKLAGEPGRRLAALGRALRLLGALPEGYSLVEGMKKAYSEEILALYDIEESKVFLVKEALERDLTPQERRQRAAGQPTLRDITLAHEMVHALQHQHNSDLNIVESEDPDLDDVKVALHAFVEGEATIHGLVASGAAAPRYAQLADSLEAGARGKYTDEPPLIRRALYFPYISGARHLASKVADDIRGTAPRLHEDIPLSTEHLLHGRTTEEDPPSAVFLPDLSDLFGEGFHRSYEGVLGEAYLVPLLGAGGEQRAGPASRFGEGVRWGGDRLQLYEENGGSPPAVVLVTLWDDFESTEVVMQRAEASGFPTVRKGRTVALVVGRPEAEARKIAETAIDKAVVAPFRSLEELKARRADFSGK